jgi:hypothetical protein
MYKESRPPCTHPKKSLLWCEGTLLCEECGSEWKSETDIALEVPQAGKKKMWGRP